MPNDFCTISTDKARIDTEVVHNFLENSYWAAGIPRETVAVSIENSLCFGAYLRETGRMIGFARVVTDYVTFAYLCDVFVLDEFRSQGVAKQLIRAISEHPVKQKVHSILLATRDAHELYRAFGFEEVKNPAALMEVFRPNMYIS